MTYEPQLTEPPDADPLVRWCGRETAGITGCPLSRFGLPHLSERPPGLLLAFIRVVYFKVLNR